MRIIFSNEPCPWPHRILVAICLVCILLIPSLTWALNLVADVELLSGYDDNINRKEDKKKTESAFVSVIPAISLNGQMTDGITAGGGYEFTYTQYLSDGLENEMLHRGWGDITVRLRPRLFLNLTGRMEVLENQESPDDDGWGFTLSPGLTYHVTDTLSARVIGMYSRWRYDNLNFDSGRAIIRLEEPQVDNRYTAEAGVTYLLFLSTYLDLAYRFTYNESNNSIDEYNVHNILVGLNSAIVNNVKMALGYSYGKWNYFNWRAGKMLKGKLRDDNQHNIWLGLEYSAASFLDLVFSAEITINDSNLCYESFNRHLVYGGIRLHWERWGL
jgi:opacity protein-like surface antigen